MCDTLAIKRGGAVWFAKNSDREPDEVQRIEAHPAARVDRSAKLRCTYIEIDEVGERRGVILSRPAWRWGAEMGVNDAGVAIGNEAVFLRSVMKRGEALLGMDVVRLGLERAESASQAVEIMIGLLERHGQGGGAGFRDRNFRYDNSFLIADGRSIFVLETAGRDWVVKDAHKGWSISNTYTLSSDYDRSSPGAGADFKATHETYVLPRLACASTRRAATISHAQSAPLNMSLRELAGILRNHAAGDGFDRGSNRDLCMHSKGPLRPHASTSSMIVRLNGGAPCIAFTGTIHPCISLFKPVALTGDAWTVCSDRLFAAGAASAKRANADASWRNDIRQSIEAAEPSLLAAIERGDLAAAEDLAADWSANWLSLTPAD